MGTQKRRKIGFPIFVGALIAMVTATIGYGLFLAGTPQKERLRQFDDRRINDIITIASFVDEYYKQELVLPKNLAKIDQKQLPHDPHTNIPYEYRVIEKTMYELCATFDLSSDEIRYRDARSYPKPVFESPFSGTPDFSHGTGYYCFSFDAALRTAPPSCGLTAPCPASQTCALLPEHPRPICVPEGQECRAAGCSDECVVAESYPIQVRCTN